MSLALHDASALEPGARLDRYELLCPIAHGGMASVWIARLQGKHGFEKLVAVKTILPQYASDIRFQQMFLDEARIASGIEHANVAQILDLGEQHDVLYLVMEWVDGDSLSKLNRAVLKRGKKMPLGILLRILADTCGGLHAAHEIHGKDGILGVVHRDVSPQNILVSTKGIAKLIDFGVAKARDRVAGDTSAGQLKGKIHYMAPEQALGKSVDRRADIWSLGAVAYHLLAGVPPYDGANELATLHLLTSGNPPPPLPDTIPIAVADVVFRALVNNPEERIGTAADLQHAIEQAMIDAGVQTTTTQVAAFAADYLADRADARRRSLDLALQAASERVRVQKMIQPAASDSSSGIDHVVPRSREGTTGSGIMSTPSLSGKKIPSSTAPGIGPSGAPRSSGMRPPTPPEFIVDFEADDEAASAPSAASVLSSATLGSVASEIQWPPPGMQPSGWRRWAAWGAVGGLGVFALILILFFSLRGSGEESSAAAGKGGTNGGEPAPVPPSAQVEAPAPPPAPPTSVVATSSPHVPTPTPTQRVKSTQSPAPSPTPKSTVAKPPQKKDYGF